jgi:hypothetical protein
MSREGRSNTRSGRLSSTTKYDAHNNVLSQTYGALADLRRELADSKTRVAEREDLLRIFAGCRDSQRAWLLLEDYFEKLSLTRKDFPGQHWWPRMLTSEGRTRLEEVALLFLRANRSLPSELQPYANLTRFAEIEQAEEEEKILARLEEWLCPPTPAHLDSPRASLRVLCTVQPAPEHPALHALSVRLNLFRPRTGEKIRPVSELIELTHRAAHEQELFAPEHWEFIKWLSDTYAARPHHEEHLLLSGLDLLQWLARWGREGRLELQTDHGPSSQTAPASNGATNLSFLGQVLSLTPHIENGKAELSFTHRIRLPDGEERPLNAARFFAGDPPLALVGTTFFLLRQVPPPELLEFWAKTPAVPVHKLSHRLRTYLRRTHADSGSEWEQLCTTHSAVPQFIFELNEDTVQLRLLARSDRDQSMWHWTGQEWQRDGLAAPRADKPEVLEDRRLEAAVAWLRRLDWFTPEPSLWVSDANEAFLATLAHAWPDKPNEADYLGNPAFQRLFLAPRQLRPRLLVKGSGIDWFAVSAEWEAEGLKLSPADLERLATATGRFVKLPDAGWLELDTKAVSEAHETIADLGLDALSAIPQQVGLEQGAVMDENSFARFVDSPEAKALRQKLAGFEGIPTIEIPSDVKAEVRPYQRDGFNFLCHLTDMRLGGILADDMGLGKTLQTLSWLAWLHRRL